MIIPNLPSCGIIPLLRRHLRRPNNAGLVTDEENVHVLCDVFPSQWYNGDDDDYVGRSVLEIVLRGGFKQDLCSNFQKKKFKGVAES